MIRQNIITAHAHKRTVFIKQKILLKKIFFIFSAITSVNILNKMKLLKKPSCRKNNNNNITNEILLQNSSKILETFGWFQVRSLVFISFANLGCGLSLMSFVFLNIVPPFECKKQEIFVSYGYF